jgi:DNA replication protein DnaC
LRAYLSGFGLLLTGSAGVGKTFLMQCLGIRIYNADSIVDYGLSEIYKWYEFTDGGAPICIDDVGTERTVSEYGNKDDVLKSVLAHRNDRQQGITHITTNLDAEGIAQRYGERTLSRMLGMCKAFSLEGVSLRGPVAKTGGAA